MPMAAPGMAAQDTFQPQPSAFQRAIFLNSFGGVLRAGGRVAATWHQVR